MVMFRVTHSFLRKTTDPQNKHFGVPETCTKLSGAFDVRTTVNTPTFCLEMLRVITFREKQRKPRFAVFY